MIVSNLLWLAMVDHIMYNEQPIFPHSLHHPNYAGAWRVAGYIVWWPRRTLSVVHIDPDA